MRADICWVNNFTRDEVYTQFRGLVLSLLTKDLEQVHWGFKEIRYYQPQHVIWFLREMFPNCKFVFLVRNPADTIASGLSAWGDPAKIIDDEDAFRKVVWERFKGWTSKYALMINHEDMLGEDALFLCYEDLVQDPGSHLCDIFGMLDLETPKLALDLFHYRVASTQNHPYKAALVERIQEYQRNSKHEGLRKICARMGYEHLA